MIGALVAALLCGEDIVIDEVRSSSVRADGEARVTLVGGVDLDAAHTRDDAVLRGIARLAGLVTWEPSAAVEVRFGTRAALAIDTDLDDAETARLIEPRLSLRWRGDASELAIGWDDRLRWSQLVDPLPGDLRLGPLPTTGEVDDRRRSIPFVTARHTLGAWSFEGLWQPLAVEAGTPGELGGAGADGLAGGALGARAALRDSAWSIGASWLWRRATVGSLTRQHVVGLDAEYTTGVVHLRAEAAWSSSHSDWLAARRQADEGALEGLFSISASPSIIIDLEAGVRALSDPGVAELWLRLTLLMAYDGVARLDAEWRFGIGREDHQLNAAIVVRAATWAEIGVGLTWFSGMEMDDGLGALYDAADQVWARLALDF